MLESLVQSLEWYDIFVVLFTTILSFADPITDILTLVEFYREDHKTWFGVGLAFVVLPCLFFSALYYFCRHECKMKPPSRARSCTQVFLCGFNPFSPAFVKLQTLMFYLKNFKKLWRGDKIRPSPGGTTSEKEVFLLRSHNKLAMFFEATVESAPQFVLQLYAMSVQQVSVKIIQMISLPVSFLSLALASTVADEFTSRSSVKNNLLLFATHLFLLSSRLVAISLFTVSYKWWITSVLIFHLVAILVADAPHWFCHRMDEGDGNAGMTRFAVFFICLHWLRDDISFRPNLDGDNAGFERMRLFSNLLFVIENIVMILLFYFSQFCNNWYALPVTVCVCLFSVLGAITRVTHFYCLTKTTNHEIIFPSLVRFSSEEHQCYAVQHVSTV